LRPGLCTKGITVWRTAQISYSQKPKTQICISHGLLFSCVTAFVFQICA
jgi:hypothetical protein